MSTAAKETTMDPTPHQLLLQVALRDDYKPSAPCPAWIESADRTCGREPTHDYLCKRHDTIARRRHADSLHRETQERERQRERIRAHRAANLTKWRTRLERIESEITSFNAAGVTDRAAYTGLVHPSINRKRMAALSDSNVQRMAKLHSEAETLRKLIGTE